MGLRIIVMIMPRQDERWLIEVYTANKNNFARVCHIYEP